MEEMNMGKKEKAEDIRRKQEKEKTEDIRKKYENERLYKVTSALYIDDETDEEKTFFFKKPEVASFDRYIKNAAQNNTRAIRTFVLDNIVEEQRADLEGVLEEYPAFALSVGEKLLAMLGLAKDTSVKKL